MKVILLGYGNVGKELEKVLNENGVRVDVVIRNNNKEDFLKELDEQSVVFISIPTRGDDPESLEYYQQALEKGASIVTCEKGVLSHHFDLINKHPGKIKYTATVGGDSGILNAVSEHQDQSENILEIKAVINGTLNYIGDQLGQGQSEEEVAKEAVEKGFAEPGAHTFAEVVEGELKDVLCKTVILANHSKIYDHLIIINDISIERYQKGKRCGVVLTSKEIKAGFIFDESESWFSTGVNNVLCINGMKIVEGPGAGARATAERMYRDFVEII